jgi:hypothetical protein
MRNDPCDAFLKARVRPAMHNAQRRMSSARARCPNPRLGKARGLEVERSESSTSVRHVTHCKPPHGRKGTEHPASSDRHVTHCKPPHGRKGTEHPASSDGAVVNVAARLQSDVPVHPELVVGSRRSNNVQAGRSGANGKCSRPTTDDHCSECTARHCGVASHRL